MADIEDQHKSLVMLLSNKPSKDAKATTINFPALGLPEYDNHFAIVIDNLFSRTECNALIAGAERSTPTGWEQAMVNIGNGQQRMDTNIRLCDRILWDNKDIAGTILERVLPHLPAEIITLRGNASITGRGPVKRKEVWQISRLNERLRFLRYTKGMYFRPHRDGSYVTPDQKEITFLTVHLYLNDDDAPLAAQRSTERDSDKPLLGGATRFFGLGETNQWDINPRTGSVLVFQHRNLIHSGDDVKQGTKYTMRSDILYCKVDAEVTETCGVQS